MNPLVTVVTPTFNRAAFIPRAIETFLSQTFTNSEMLIVDDGNDGTHQHIPDHPRIRYVRLTGQPRSTGEKRNICAELALGDILVHQDDDDSYASTYVEAIVDFLLSSGKSVVGLHSILYHQTSEAKAYQFAAQYPPYACGAGQAYFREYWRTHQFAAKRVGEDSLFCSTAFYDGQLASMAGHDLIVARAHGLNTYEPSFEHPCFTPMNMSDLPSWYKY
jgi:glycosyltransferase involved in cell wall biosynthesis